MKFTLKSKDLFSHLVLNNKSIAEKISETKAWKEAESLEGKVFVNGVEIPAESLNQLLKDMQDQANIETGAEAFRKEVENKAYEIVGEQQCETLSALDDLRNKISEVDTMIKFPWEE